MNKDYLRHRQEDNYISYRMNSRAGQIINSLSKLAPFNCGRILDAGAAEGRILSRIAGSFGFKCAVGIDNCPDAVSAAAAKNDGKVKVFMADIVKLPFKDGVFDIVLASAVLEHIRDIDSAMREFYRVLRPGGLLCVTLPNPAYDFINSILVKTYHVRRHSLAGMKNILCRAKFSVLDARHFMVFPFARIALEGAFVRLISRMKLGFLLFNFIITARKREEGRPFGC